MNWDLDRLYKGFGDPALERDFAQIGRLADEQEALLKEGKDETRVLRESIANMGGLAMLSAKIGGMVLLTLATDAQCAEALSSYDRFMKVSLTLEQLTSAWARYVGGVRDLRRVIASDPLLLEHEYLLEQLKEKSRHTLDAPVEGAVLRMQLTGGRAWERLRDMLEADLTVKYTLGGDSREMTLPEVRALAYASERDVRKAAYDAEIAGYKAIETPMAACLSAIKGEALTLAPLKAYGAVLDETLENAHISRDVLFAMLRAIEEALPMFRRYLRAKAKHLGYEGGLKFYDLFAPLGDAGEAFTLDGARALLIQVLGAFSPKMGEMIARAFDEKWIDAYPYAGKQGGAFCSSVYPLGISYVLTNFDGSFNSVSTLAHELGHAYHDQQLYKNSILNSSPPMTLAETASIFNETLLTQSLMRDWDQGARLMLLDQELMEATQTVVDILSRYYFEEAVFEARKTHALTAGELKDLMLASQRRAYGDGLDEAVMHPYMWACKGHYYSADLHFYNFPYAFGLLFGKGIYKAFEDDPRDAAERYEALLRQTALLDCAEVARSIGIDIATPDFWKSALSVIGEAVTQFESLTSA